MAKIIHEPSEIKKGKLYKSLRKEFYDTVLYLGCVDTDTYKQSLVIVMDDIYNAIGHTVSISKLYNPDSIWAVGFEEQDG